MTKRYEDISGKIFYDAVGEPTCQALWYLESVSGHAKWLFRCLVNGPGCKGTFVARTYAVKQGRHISCGCYHKRKISTKLGLHNSPEYAAWKAMHQRCYNPNNDAYHNYGGRGIEVDWEWHKNNPDGFANFLRDKGYITDPNKNTNDRLDNDSNYGPKNDNGWQDRETQARNRSTNVIKDLEEAEFIRDLYFNKKVPIKNIAEFFRCSSNTVRRQL